MDHFQADFTVVLRGYDREQVDAFLAKATRQALTPRQLQDAGFTVAWRGYDRAQVDDFIARLAASSEQDGSSQPSGGKHDAPPSVGFFDATMTMPDFTVVLRGYDRGAVDTLYARVQAQLSGDGAAMPAEEIRTATFPVGWRGYDREQVDTMFAALADLVDHQAHGQQ